MINVEATVLHSNFSLVVKDHAETQVCAATSAITCGFVSFCLSHQEKLRNLRYSLKKGDSYVSFTSDDEFVNGAFRMAEIAYLGLEAGYPKEIKVLCNP